MMKLMIHIFGLLGLLLLSSCGSNPAKPEVQSVNEEVTEKEAEYVSLEEFCAEFVCREQQLIRLMTDAGPMDQELDLYWPVVQGDRLSLLPGDQVYIEADLVDGQFINLKQVDTISQPEKTMVFDFSQAEDGVDMFLNVSNPFEQVMKYHLDMIDFEGNFHETSSCAIMPGTSVFELWPHPIPELIVSNIRALEATDSISCEY